MRALPLMAYLSVPMLGIGIAGCTVGPNYQSPEIAEAPRRTSLETAGMASRTVEGDQRVLSQGSLVIGEVLIQVLDDPRNDVSELAERGPRPFIPLVASLFMAVHFWRIRRDGISGPPL